MDPELSLRLTTWSKDEPADRWRSLRTVARAADAVGIDRLVMSDHVVMGENLDAYGDPARGGQAGGRQPTGPDGHWLDPLAVIAHLSAITDRVRFGTNILLAALRRPVVLAGQCATIDVLSEGRLDLGVGVGWQREEYEAAGLSYADRGRLLDHTLEVCRQLWTEDAASHESDELQFSGIHQQPKPVQSGGVPIWVSGTVNPRSMRRLARFGSGWIPWGADAADLAASIGHMRDAVTEHGRDPSSIGVVGGLRVVTDDDGAIDVDATLEPVADAVAAGVTTFHTGVTLPADVDDAAAMLQPLVTAFRAATRRT
ncbi:TIGR03619 family F420-dependent LLM class oxidoreductase [Actinospongicola halichondriae]|uniref:TIGR03619 family F420-dependent LLM class oxidoreductase n=1 Tax=Actinospongicola halichondriae TaxID=3236844 RepID=UPI003D524728